MNYKALMFAGLGLAVSIGATSWWVGNDMANIRAANAARLARCTQLRSQAAATTAGSQQAGAAVDPSAVQHVAAPADPAAAAELAKCPKPEVLTSTMQEGGATQQPADTYAADQSYVPSADSDVGGYSDTTSADEYADPATAGMYVDPDAEAGADEYGDGAPAANENYGDYGDYGGTTAAPAPAMP